VKRAVFPRPVIIGTGSISSSVDAAYTAAYKHATEVALPSPAERGYIRKEEGIGKWERKLRSNG